MHLAVHVVELAGGAAIGAVFVWSANLDHRPAILSTLGTNETLEIEAAWDTKLKETFPVGTPESKLIATVAEWGFTLRQTKTGTLYADYQGGAFVCSSTYGIGWESGADRTITAVHGSADIICL